MRTTRRRTGLTVIAALLSVGAVSLGASPATSAAANRANGPCTKAGAKATIKGKVYVCTTRLGKKLWLLPEATPTTVAAAAAATTAAPAKADNWDDIVAKAKAEGKVMIYSSQDSARLAEVAAKFKAKYGITMEIYRDIDANILPKVEAEKSTGKGIADVVAQASAPWAELREGEGWFVAPKGPSFSNGTYNRAANISKGGTYFTTTAAILTFGWNTRLWSKGLTDYSGLLDPGLQGKVGVIDPGGSAAITDFYYYLEEKFGAGFTAKLATQRPRIYASSLPMKAALASGEIAAALFIPPPLDEKAAGAPVDFGFSDTVWGARFNTSIVKTAPHPNAAQVLADYMVGEEAQAILAKAAASVYPGIGLMTTDKVRVQNVPKLTPAAIAAYNERWKILFN